MRVRVGISRRGALTKGTHERAIPAIGVPDVAHHTMLLTLHSPAARAAATWLVDAGQVGESAACRMRRQLDRSLDEGRGTGGGDNANSDRPDEQRGGRLTRAVIGVALIACGLLAVGGLAGVIVALVGLVPLGMGIWGRCLLEFAPRPAARA